jgi:ABC-type sugar transport system ATPase subunit
VRPAALEISQLAAPFGRHPGLSRVSFGVAPGERLVIVGRSGSGKTTLLRAIAGLGGTTAGRVRIGGRDVTAEPAERRDAVYLHQTPLLFPHLSVAGNVAFPLQVRGVGAAEVERRVRDALAAVQLDSFGHRAPRTLSGGQRHRVALARAVVARPAVLLLDEPLSALDPTLREEVREALLALQRAYHPALVLVTHDLDEAGLLADRIGVLIEGRLAQIAPPAELFDRPESLAIAQLLGIPNFLPGRVLADGRFESAIGTWRPDSPLPAGPATAVFGPDALANLKDGVAAEVVELRHRPRGTTAIIRLGDHVLEMRLSPGATVVRGDRIGLGFTGGRGTIISDAAPERS